MGTYKVPQNVEAEDKILGPLSLKQFIYAMIGVGYGLLTFAILNPISTVLWVMVGVPPMLALLGLGLYQREDQPLETFVVAMVEFFTRPHIRTWQKEPVAEVFRLEPPPPKPEMIVRDPTQVRSQLTQLANLVDTRGWVGKQPELQEPDEAPVIDLKDRLGSQGLTEQPVITRLPEVTEDDDILSSSNTSAQELNVLIENTVKSVREEALEKAKRAAVGKTPKKPSQTHSSISGSTAAPSGDILKLATEGGDLTVAQIAAQAHRHTNLTEGQAVNVRHAETS